MMRKIRIGFIGAGGIARAHARWLQEIPEAQIVAIAEPNPASVARLVQEFPEMGQLPVFTDYLDMLTKVELDAVEISTPHTLHYQEAKDVLLAGKHLLMEKPMVCTLAHARDLMELSKGRVVLISYQHHFMGPYIYIRNHIQSGALGELQFVSGVQMHNWMRDTFGTWRQQPSLSGGGQLMDTGSHLVDILLWMTGLQTEQVSAYMCNYETPVDIDSTLSVRFTNGALGSIVIVGDSPFENEDFGIWGKDGMIMRRNGVILKGSFGDKQMSEVTAFPPDSNPDRNFVDAILGRDEVRVPPECGLRAVELTEAAYKSANLGRSVWVSELA